MYPLTLKDNIKDKEKNKIKIMIINKINKIQKKKTVIRNF